MSGHDDNLRLHYDVTENELYKEQNRQNYEQIKKLLIDVGIHFNVENGKLYLSVIHDNYNDIKKRNAGRRKKAFSDGSQKGYECYRYADIVFMLQNMTDKEICEKTGISSSTFYRRKKELKESKYYKSLDKNRLGDMEYLKSVDENLYF